jgi:tripartite-type tricarboxylate transporter receptor subunit TctC
LIGHRLSEALGQQVVIDNRPGGGGNIGTDAVAKAPADGYTLLSAGPGSLIMNPVLMKVPYETARDFAQVSLMAHAPNVLVVHPSVPAKTVKELLALAVPSPAGSTTPPAVPAAALTSRSPCSPRWRRSTSRTCPTAEPAPA